MTSVSDFLIEVGIATANTLDERLSTIAKAVSSYLNAMSEGVIWEIEVVNALNELQEQGFRNLRPSDSGRLSKPPINHFYNTFGVKHLPLRDALLLSLQDSQPIEVRYEAKRPAKTPQKFDSRIILYKDDEKLRRYIQSKASLYPKVVYSFDVPDQLVTIRNGLMQRCSH